MSSSGATIDERAEPEEENKGLDENTSELFFDAAVDDRADEAEEEEEEKVADKRPSPASELDAACGG